MDESSALLVTAVRAVETGDATHRVWSDADRSWASRAAAEVVGEGASPDTFIARRARLAGERLGEAHRALPRAVAALRWRPWVGWTLVAGAFVLGIAFDRVGGAQRVNLLAPPVFALLAWNVAVYAALAAAAVLRLGGDRGPGPLRALVARLGGRAGGSRASPPPAAKRVRRRHRRVPRRAALPPGRASRHRSTRRAAPRILHLAAAALALGVIAGLYTARARLRVPRHLGEHVPRRRCRPRRCSPSPSRRARGSPGLPSPTSPPVAAMRAPGSENAARWLHLMAGSVVAIVVLPRLVLAALAGLVERRRATAAAGAARRALLPAPAARLPRRAGAPRRRAVQLRAAARRHDRAGGDRRPRVRRQRGAGRRGAARVWRRGRVRAARARRTAAVR